MKEEIKKKLYDAKMGLLDLRGLFNGTHYWLEDPDVRSAIQRRVIFALEAIDDAIEGKIRFPKKCLIIR